jgi:hypothetical protein
MTTGLVCYEEILFQIVCSSAVSVGSMPFVGGTFEFRESLEIAYRFGARWRAGVSLAHISNARIYRNDPAHGGVRRGKMPYDRGMYST